jgi:hypothetical protein
MDLDVTIGRLRANADAVAALVADVDERQARWKPEPDKWSILEVMCHLADEEVEDFGARLSFTLSRPAGSEAGAGTWPPIDPRGWPESRGYNRRDLALELERFLAARRGSLAWLASLDDPDWTHAYPHPSIGPITAGDLLTSWVAHDHIHIRQLNRLQREYLVGVLSPYSPRYAGRW